MVLVSRAPDRSDPYATAKSAFCWIFSAFAIVGGFLGFVFSDGWMNEIVASAIRVVLGICLLPPVLTELRKYIPAARPIYAPVLLALGGGVLAVIAQHALIPSPAGQLSLQRAAMTRAEGWLQKGKASTAAFTLRRYQPRRQTDKALDALLRRIEAGVNRPGIVGGHSA